MKKLIILISIILCLAVIGSVLAIAVYDATPIGGGVNTDTYLYLSLNSERGTGVTLNKNNATLIPIVLGIDTNEESWTGSATLTIKPEAVEEGKTIEHVTIGYYSDLDCTKAVGSVSDAGVFTYSVSKGTTVYVKIEYEANVTAAQVNATNGKLVCTFNVA